MLRELTFAHEEAVLIPVECLGPDGIEADFSGALRSTAGFSGAWINQFNRGYRLYWQRARALAEAAPEFHFPPRRQNLCIVRAPEAVPPYFMAFERASWQLQASDFEFEPSLAADEFAAFIFLHSERLVAARDMGRACIDTASYWLTRSPEERAAFREIAAQLTRPDAELFRIMAEALPWLTKLYHVQLRPPPQAEIPQLKTFREAGLYIPPEVVPKIMGYAPALRAVAERCAEAYLEHQAQERVLVADRSQAEQNLCAWLRDQAPRLAIVDGEHQQLWSPEQPAELSRLRRELSGAPSRALASILEDLKVISARSQSLAKRCDLDQLPRKSDDTEHDGGVYIDAEALRVVYSLKQPGLEVLREPAPPFHRLLLATRTAHEWGHLCHEAGWVSWPNPDTSDDTDYTAARRAVFDAVRQLLDHASPAYRQNVATELEPTDDSPATYLLTLLERRASDYASNLIAREVVTSAEFSAYVRANVHSNSAQGDGAWQLLARQCYEFQYLRLAGIESPLAYFLGSSWFEQSWVTPGHLRLDDVEALFEAVAGLFAHLCIDTGRFQT